MLFARSHTKKPHLNVKAGPAACKPPPSPLEHVIVPDPFQRSFPKPIKRPGEGANKAEKTPMPRPLRRFRPVILFFLFFCRQKKNKKKKQATSPSSGSGPHFLNHSPPSAFPPPLRHRPRRHSTLIPGGTCGIGSRLRPPLSAGGAVTFYSRAFRALFHPPCLLAFYKTSPTESPRSSNNPPPHLTHQKRKFDALPLRRQTFQMTREFLSRPRHSGPRSSRQTGSNKTSGSGSSGKKLR